MFLVSIVGAALLLPSTTAFAPLQGNVRIHHVNSIQGRPINQFRQNCFRPQYPPRNSAALILSDATSTPPTSELVPDEDFNQEDERNKSKLITLYQSMTYLYGLVGLVLWALPDRTLTIRLASKWGGAAGFGVAAGVSHILAQATIHDRLNSDTYKRLNVGMLAFSTLGLAAVPGEAAFAMEPTTAMVVAGLSLVVRLVGIPVAYAGWKRGTVTSPTVDRFGPKQMLQELGKGTKATWQGLKVQHRKKALTYRNSLFLVACAIVSSFMEGVFGVRYRSELNKSFFLISLQWSAVARLVLISTMIYSLKDAAERDRLSGTTFIQLNWLVAAWGILVWMGQCISSSGFAVKRGEMLLFSLPFLIKGIKSLKEKSDAKKPKPSS